MLDFEGFPKITRFFEQDVIVTEKIDGTNGIIKLYYDTVESEELQMAVGSRNRWITPEKDNYGFAKWCERNKEELLSLGEGTHYGEWWGNGIQRRYGMDKKVFSLFNTHRWSDELGARPECCDVVPVTYQGTLTPELLESLNGDLPHSIAAEKYGVKFNNPEGRMIFFSKARKYFKIPLDKGHKG